MPDVPIYNFTDTWNDGATTYKGIQLDVTDTASAAASRLIDLQVGGASKFSVDNAGRLKANELGFTNGGLAKIVHNGAAGNGGQLNFHQHDSGNGVSMLTVGNYSVSVPLLEITNGAATSPALLTLRADSAATLQLGEDHATVATGQTIKAHDVVTGTGADLILSGGSGDAANGDVVLQPTSGSVGIGTTTPATTLDVVGSIAATGTVKSTPTTVGALPAAATAGAGARTFVTDSANSLSSHHGQTVSGGGTNFTPVYSDGTNWLTG